ncbi:MAG: type II toxin-antitoxin system prevent-host-death family antitoxin [Gammaproteobacteria bacterium]|nr:type II toxin-antitoxin system prevent-host-death family antitoxin [Gammaproteobacteria bacterium]
MTTASVSDLKANLSRYLREVRRGGEVQILDRGAPVSVQ